MSYIELFLLALSLCFDTFAVSITGGICTPGRLRRREIVRIILFFAFFQASFTFVGCLLGMGLSDFISRVDHWIAFLLLGYIGVKMIIEGTSSEEDASEGEGEECKQCYETGRSLRNIKNLTLLSIATSIDALAVGISISLLHLGMWKMSVGTGMVFLTTAAASLLGLVSGRKLGSKAGKRSEIAGGVILILIGAKILVEHLTC